MSKIISLKFKYRKIQLLTIKTVKCNLNQMLSMNTPNLHMFWIANYLFLKATEYV